MAGRLTTPVILWHGCQFAAKWVPTLRSAWKQEGWRKQINIGEAKMDKATPIKWLVSKFDHQLIMLSSQVSARDAC